MTRMQGGRRIDGWRSLSNRALAADWSGADGRAWYRVRRTTRSTPWMSSRVPLRTKHFQHFRKPCSAGVTGGSLFHFRTVPRMARHFLISALFVHNACLRVANPSVQRGNETRPTRDLPKIGRRCGHAQYSRRGLFLIGLWQLLDGRIQLRPQFVQSTAGIGQSALLRLQLRSHFRCSGRTLLLRINCIG